MVKYILILSIQLLEGAKARAAAVGSVIEVFKAERKTGRKWK